MECFVCQGDVIWQSDFDGEDVGYPTFEIVTFYTCMDCKAEYEVCIGAKEDDDISETTGQAVYA